MCLIEYQTYLHIKIKSRNKRKAGGSIYCVIIQRILLKNINIIFILLIAGNIKHNGTYKYEIIIHN
jgi:hypothetical protein